MHSEGAFLCAKGSRVITLAQHREAFRENGIAMAW